MELLARLFSLASIPLFILGFGRMIRQVNREQALSQRGPLVNLVISPLLLAFNVIVLRQAQVNAIGPLFLILGIGFGLAWGLSTRLSLRDGSVIGKQSALHLVFWAFSLAITQLLVVVAPASWVVGGLVLMFFSTGTTLGTSLNLLVRMRRLEAG